MNFDQKSTHQLHISINNAAATKQALGLHPAVLLCCLDWESSILT